MEMFKKLYVEWKGEEQFKDPQYKAIPRFYFKVHTLFCDRDLLQLYLYVLHITL